MSSLPLPALHSYASSTGLGSPSTEGSTGSIQPGGEKTGIFIENAASSILLPKTEYRTTPHVGGDAGIGISSNKKKDDKTAAQTPGEGWSLFIQFQVFPELCLNVVDASCFTTVKQFYYN